MDNSVLEAMKKWPNIPAVYGWLSLTARGEWRMHPQAQPQGESIANQQIIAFIERNYAVDRHGAAYFQNGPQKVYVRLEKTPWVLHLDTHHMALLTHTLATIHSVHQWHWIHNELFLQTPLGIACFHDHAYLDLLEYLEGQLHSGQYVQGNHLFETLLEKPYLIQALGISKFGLATTPLTIYPQISTEGQIPPIEKLLGFIANPTPTHGIG